MSERRIAKLVANETRTLRVLIAAWEKLHRTLMANPYLDAPTRDELSRVRSDLGDEIRKIQSGK